MLRSMISMAKNKNHWYDGWFYDTIIAPNQDKLFGQIKDLVPPQSTIIDVGCGTGRLEFFLAGKCKSLIGIDLSKKNIDRAKQTLLKNPDARISFQHSNPGELINKSGSIKFDYAILTYVIHEVNEGERIDLLRVISFLADKIIIGDYIVPRPDGFAGFMSKTIEFIAGREHYRNYKSYVADGGIVSLAKKAGLNIIDVVSTGQLINHIVVLEK
jgi:SAM-dependent methyltransferase